VGFYYSTFGGWGFGFNVGTFYHPRPWWGPANAAFWHGGAGHFDRYNVGRYNIYHRWGGAVRVSSALPAQRAPVNPVNRAKVNLSETHAHLGNNNVFAGPYGNVYRQTPQGKWEQHINNTWRAAEMPASHPMVQQRLNYEARARVIGNERALSIPQLRTPISPGLPRR
jgi:hypothetical protein